MVVVCIIVVDALLWDAENVVFIAKVNIVKKNNNIHTREKKKNTIRHTYRHLSNAWYATWLPQRIVFTHYKHYTVPEDIRLNEKDSRFEWERERETPREWIEKKKL